MYRFLIRTILAVFFMSIITACGGGDTATTPTNPSEGSKIQLEKETQLTSNKDDTDDKDDSSGSGSDSGVSNTTSGDSGSETASSGQGSKSNSDAALGASGSSISRGGDVKPPPTVPPTVPPIVPPTEPENPACTLAICDNNAGVEDLPNYHPSPSIAGKSAFLTIETGKDIDTTGLVNEQLVAIGSEDILRGSRPGDARDGWQAFSGKLASDPQGDNVYFAGLLPTTDLGRPLSTAPTTTTWPGTFTFGGFENHAIDFEIDFANRQIDARTVVNDSEFSTSFALGFSEGGSVNGTVLRYSTHESQFTSDGTYLLLGHYRAMGLIGQEGLVGALVNIKGYIEDSPFGGFSADNPVPESDRPVASSPYVCPVALCDNRVSAADLPNYPTSVNPAGGSGFLTILPSEDAEQPTMIDTTGVMPATDNLLIITDSRAGDENDGWQAFYGKLASDPQGDDVYFAGILPTTDLGPPLITAPMITTWPGTFNFAGEEGSVNFEIDFASRTIDGQGITQQEIDSNADRQQKHITDSIAQDSTLTESDITALIIPRREFIRFSLGFSETGTVFGSILRNSNPEGQDPFYGDNISVRGYYQATGLIGQEGLVGAVLMSKDGFIANAPYGGFVADNPNNQ